MRGHQELPSGRISEMTELGGLQEDASGQGVLATHPVHPPLETLLVVAGKLEDVPALLTCVEDSWAGPLVNENSGWLGGVDKELLPLSTRRKLRHRWTGDPGSIRQLAREEPRPGDTLPHPTRAFRGALGSCECIHRDKTPRAERAWATLECPHPPPRQEDLATREGRAICQLYGGLFLSKFRE